MKTLKTTASPMQSFKTISLVGLCLGFAWQSAYAQQPNNSLNDAGWKVRGYSLWSSQQHAQDQSQILYYHSQAQQPIPKQEAKDLVAGVRKDLATADKEVAKFKAAHAKEPEVLKQIALIEKHHAKAHEVCGMAEEHCLKEKGDQVVIGDCCSEMWHELDAAKAETLKLMKMLKIDKLEPPKKVTTKKEAAK